MHNDGRFSVNQLYLSLIEISISWCLINAFFPPFFSCLPSRSSIGKEIFFFFFLIFIFTSPRTVNGKSLCRKRSFRPGFQTATFVPLFLGLTVIRRYDDRYVNRRFADFRPSNVQISTQRDEATSARNVAICISQRIANPTCTYLARRRAFVRTKSVPADGLFFFLT